MGGGEANVMGYISQGMSYGLRNDYDTKRGVNSLITTALVEGEFKPNNNLKFYGALMATGDQIYSARNGGGDWTTREFDKSSGNLRLDDKGWQVLRELHVTYSGDRGMLRLGKQIVKWGEMDGTQVIDTINPVDQRRGFADVEFETSVIPIWLARAEYYPENKPSWLVDLGLEYVLNPNLQFIPSQAGQTGNDAGGVWGPGISPVPTGTYNQVLANFAFGPPPFGIPIPVGTYLPTMVTGMFPSPPLVFGPNLQSRMGSNAEYNVPNLSGRDGIEHAFRIKANFGQTVATFNAYSGREKLPVMRDIPGSQPVLTVASDGSIVEHHRVEGFYPKKNFLGVTASTDLTSLGVASLGGVSPVLRVEALYQFGKTFAVGRMPIPGAAPTFDFEKYDMWRSGIGLDWKAKINFLNDRNFIVISPQLFWDRVIKYPTDALVLLGPNNVGFEKNNYAASLMLSTAYFNDKLMPKLFVIRDITNRAYWTRLELGYTENHRLSYTVGAQFLGGSDQGKSLNVFENKDHIFAKITYKF